METSLQIMTKPLIENTLFNCISQLAALLILGFFLNQWDQQGFDSWNI